MNIYVGNLPRDITDEDLRQAFGAFGQIVSCTIVKDKFSGEPRGFGFVEVSGKDDAYSAINGLNGKELKGRRLRVNKAHPRDENQRGRGRRFGGRRF